MKKRFLVAGFGFMGQTHAWSLIHNPKVQLIGIVDPCDPLERLSIKGNRSTAVVSQEEIRAIPHYKSLEEALNVTAPDGVVIALPTKFHCSAVVDCMKAGADIFVEKPVAINLQECDEMIRTAQMYKKILAVGQVVRFMREYQFLKETIDSGRLGKLKFLKLSRYTGVPTWGNWADPEFIRASGGPLFDLVSHDVDFVRFCLGEPEKIESLRNLNLDRSQLNVIMTKFSRSGTEIVIEGGFVSPSSVPFQRSYTAYFEKGTVQSVQSGEAIEYIGTESIRHDFSYDNPYRTEVDLFVQAILTGDSSQICSGSDAAQSVKTCYTIAEQIHYPLPG